jgi:hypothetical protein
MYCLCLEKSSEKPAAISSPLLGFQHFHIPYIAPSVTKMVKFYYYFIAENQNFV